MASMTLETGLRLGRVSNLPTVWTNVMAGMALAGGALEMRAVLLLGLAASCFYVGGMFLNDAYDAEIDARERPERPIPSGEIDRDTVVRWGYGWLGVGLLLVFVQTRVLGEGGWGAVGAALVTLGLIVLYDRWHKGNPAAPIVMGLCRVGVYLIGAASVGGVLGGPVWIGCLLLLGYVVGLTYVARFESGTGVARLWPLGCLAAPVVYMLPVLREGMLMRMLIGGYAMWAMRAVDLVRKGGPGSIRGAVVSLIAGISLLDAMLLYRFAGLVPALVATAAFGATLALQRRVAGT